MTITTSDIKILASARMNDTAEGGGPMTSVAVQDGVENNVFPDISSIDRAFGRFQLRKVYAAVLAAGTDTLLGANMIVADEPDDAAVSTFLFSAANAGEERADAMQRLEQCHWEPLGAIGITWDDAALSTESVYCLRGSLAAMVKPGSVIFTIDGDGVYGQPVLIATATAGGTSGTTGGYVVTFHGPPPTLTSPFYARFGVPSNSTPRLFGTAAVSGALTAGDTTCAVDSVLTPLAPWPLGSEPAGVEVTGIDPTEIVPQGRAVVLRGGDAVVVHHTAETTPGTVANGATINCGRTNLARAVVVGNDDQPVAGGYTVNRATGVVTVSDITGWAQPVRARHTIEDVLGLSRTGYPEVRQTASAGGSVTTAGPFALSSSYLNFVMYCGRANVGAIRVYSKTGQDITDVELNGVPAFSVNRAAGTATYAGVSGTEVLDAQEAAFIASHSPVTLVASGSYSGSVAPTAPQSNPNQLTFNRGLSRDFPSGTLVSSALLMGDLQGLVGAAWSQVTWSGVWSDSRIGDPILAQYDQAGYPIVVDNRGAISERWSIIFTGSTAFRVVGESLGQIATGDTATNLAPTNPATGQPYFTLPALGWGASWSAGNVLRFNTRGANAGVWVARVVMPSAPSDTPDSMTLAVRGDINA